MSEVLAGVLSNCCPKCGNGKIFTGLFKMNATCPECDYRFEREPGYFLGAMSLSYLFAFIVTLPPFLFLLFSDVSFTWLIGVPAAIAVLISPLGFRFSRLFWIHGDYRIDTE